MKDSKFNLQQALPNAAANNNTGVWDLGIEPGNSNKYRLAQISVDVPALSDHTNTSVTNTLTLQTSSDNSNWANAIPLVQIGIVGVGTTGSAASNVQVPLPPKVSRYVRFNQNVPTNGGTGTNAVVNYDLVIP